MSTKKDSQETVVFVGPSIPQKEARLILDADFRQPCQRGDLDSLPSGTTVGLIDGVFHQAYAVSPREVKNAIDRGITILGGSSMGALRALEVPGVEGIGRIYQMYRVGLIDGDDEVALLFDPVTLVPLTVPLVNVRHAIGQLRQAGTLGDTIADRLLEAAISLHYADRTYRRILCEADIAERTASAELIALLNHYDLKRDDAQLLLEELSLKRKEQRRRGIRADRVVPADDVHRVGVVDATASRQSNDMGTVHVWETGDTVHFADLITFLKCVGRYSVYAGNALTSLLVSGRHSLEKRESLKSEFNQLCTEWGWFTNEEKLVTMADLGVSVKDTLAGLREKSLLRRMFVSLARQPSYDFLKSMRAELFINDMALKRETIRFASLRWLAQQQDGGADGVSAGAEAVLCRLNGTTTWKQLSNELSALGVCTKSLKSTLRDVSAARKTARAICRPRKSKQLLPDTDETFGIRRSLKPAGELRFSRPLSESLQHVNRLKEIVGVTRVGVISGLTELHGVFVTQVARPDGAWSSTYGSGKSDTKDGAIVGGIMEEIEKWSQERFVAAPLIGSYEKLRDRGQHVLDPRTIDLPYDSCYRPDIELAWHRCTDLIQGAPILVPVAALTYKVNRNNILYSARGGRVTFSTNGLASGFTLAEALVHATCEYIERHAARMAAARVENPGLGDRRAWPTRVDNSTLSTITKRLIEQLATAGCRTAIWNITSDIRVPTFLARMTLDRRLACGWGTHPNAEVASHMSLLEACQTVVSSVAAGREDLIIQARSLGRHQRTRPIRRRAESFWNCERGYHSLHAVDGFISDDIAAEFNWIREQLMNAGIERLVAIDLTRVEAHPIRTVRVIIPGLETTNPFHCGPRLRVVAVSDMVEMDPSLVSSHAEEAILANT